MNALLTTPEPVADPALQPTLATTPSDGTLLRTLMLVVLYAIPAVSLVRPVHDWDLWWHLRTGQWVVEHSAVPQFDPFSEYGADKPWIAYSWLFEVTLFGLFQAFGLMGIFAFRLLACLAVVMLLHRFVVRRESRFAVATGLTAAATIAMTPLWSERPWLFTLIFAILTLEVICDLREGRKSWTFWLLPFCYVIWANVHIQFIYGLFILGLACAVPLADRLLGWSSSGHPSAGGRAGTRDWWRLVGLSFVCFLATFVNPYHVWVYRPVFEYGTQTGAYKVIQELTALDFRQLPDWIVLALTLSAVYVLGRGERRSSWEFLLLAAACVFAFRSKRDVWFVLLAVLAIVPTPGLRVAPEATFALTRQRIGLIVAMTLAIMVGVFGGRKLSEQRMQEVVQELFPARAAAAIRDGGHVGPLYNNFDWGGYLIWELPHLRVCMDNRMNVHGDARMERSMQTWNGNKNWASDPDLERARLVLADSTCALASLLRLDARYRILHEDEVATVFERR